VSASITVSVAGSERSVAEQTTAAELFADGMTVGMSGFTRAGDCKAVPFALAERAAREPLSITLMTGASLGNDIDKVLTEANVIRRRIPFQSDPTLRRKINAGEVMFIDQHLSETVEQLRYFSGVFPHLILAFFMQVNLLDDRHGNYHIIIVEDQQSSGIMQQDAGINDVRLLQRMFLPN